MFSQVSVCPQGGVSDNGGLCPGGISVHGGLCPEGSLGGLSPGGSMSRGPLQDVTAGGLCPCYVQIFSVEIKLKMYKTGHSILT